MANIDYDYWIGKYEITNKQFFNFIISAIKSNKIFLKNGVLKTVFPGNEIIASDTFPIKIWNEDIYLKNGFPTLNEAYSNHPVVSVTWFGVYAFCDYYGFRIPSGAEWEKAAKGNKKWWFPWGNNIDSTYANYFNSNDPYEPGTTPIGFYNGKINNGFKTSKAESFFGCYDMAGNAWEWTNDYWSKEVPYYKGKGGGYVYHFPAALQVYYTSSYGPSKPPKLEMNDLADGFRIVIK
ncbi:MAG: SUMF1/EgtB/PvdO family nonheme iron enzyme [Chitinophagales bacterium]|nr:SUMF1/EgtB/PvdO family nonheme iron enzyme [Chitinophagales bacterium]